MISIIIPCYNSENTIDECLTSLSMQTYNNFEIIAIDDGSTDSTGTILDSWKEKNNRIKVFHTLNQGLSAARNYGVKKSVGEYIGFIDSDDSVKPTYIDTLFKTITEHNADFVAVSQYCNDLDTGMLVSYPAVTEPTVYDGYFQYAADVYLDKNKTFFFNCILATSKLYKRVLFEKIEFPIGRIIEDCWVFPELVTECKKIVVLPDCLYFYRQRKDSTTRVLSSFLVDSKIESWLRNKNWWKAMNGENNDKLVAYCEKYICHYIYKNVKYVSPSKRELFKNEYCSMVKHIIHTRHLSLKTKIKYMTIAMPLVVWKAH